MSTLSTNLGLPKPEGTDNFTRESYNNLIDSIDTKCASKDKFDSFVSYPTAGGTGTAITLTLPTLTNGLSKTFIASADNNGASTTINGKALYKPNTTTAPVLISGKAYTVWYNSTSDCFFIKVSEGSDVKLSNLVLSGNFSTFDNWNYVNCSAVSVANNTVSYQVSARYGMILQNVKKPNAGDKIYLTAKLYGATSARMIFYNRDGYGSIVTSPTVANTWQTLSAIATYPAEGVLGRVAFDDGASSGWGVIQVKEVTYLNLTQIYGAGNEPTKAEIDAKIAQDGWQDSNLNTITYDATINQYRILEGYIGYGDKRYVGNMPNNSFPTKSTYSTAMSVKADGTGNLCVAPPTGYYNNVLNEYGFGQIITNDPNFIASNIPQGKSIFGLAGTNTNKKWASGTLSSINTSTITVSGLGFTPSVIVVRCMTQYNSNAYEVVSEYCSGIHQNVATYSRINDETYAPEGDYGSYSTRVPIWTIGSGTFSFSTTSGHVFWECKYWAFE